ncbi:hypothetical protein [Streptomyces bobili]|uniref:Uncharacterized protein n=1 Tax=Streptomyces bobili TaxID=67280 RepID=A0ABZ1QQ01_9ACTN|nr:hypothetical protein [Streptomyces bobili]
MAKWVSGAYARQHSYTPQPVGRRPSTVQALAREEWRRHYPLFPRVLFILGGTGSNGVATRIDAACSAPPATAT